MALRLGYKINRFLRINKVKSCVIHTKLYSRHNPKPKYVNQSNKTASTLIQNQINQKIENYVKEEVPLQTDEIPVIISSELKNTDMIIRRKFAKSSTQIATTQPLKLPRLANPFPEPVKTLQSDIVSDEEKARLMHEQVKMEAKFHLQQHQEMLMQQKLDKMAHEQNVELNNNKVVQQELKQQQQMNDPYQNQQINNQEQKQPKYRKPREYIDLLQEEQKCKNSLNKVAINTTEKNEESIKQRRPRRTRCRKRSHTRAAKYLRHSWYPRSVRNQVRKYSTSVNSPIINPDVLSDSEQCDLIIKYLKGLYPEYENLKKPLMIPGSEEEKDFIKNILKLIGKHKTEVAEKVPAPFPSYSEVKTSVKKNKGNNNKSNIIFNTGSLPRFYSTKNKDVTIIPNKQTKKVHKFEFKSAKPINKLPKKVNVIKKQEAPYSAYSDLQEDQLNNENFDCRNINPSKQKPVYSNSRLFSTTTGELKKQAKKKPPCKNPFPPIPECDYVEQAKKNKENKRRKHCPKKKKKCSSEVDCSRIISKIKAWLSTYKPETENIKISRSQNDSEGRESYVIEVCEYKEINDKAEEVVITGDQNIMFEQPNEIVQIVQPPPDQLNVYTGARKAPFRNLEYKPIEFTETHAPEMIDPIIVKTKNIPDFISDSDIQVEKPKEPKINDKKPTKIKEKFAFNAKEIKLVGIQNKITNNPKETQINKVQQILKTKIDTSHVNKVKEHLRIKPKKAKEIVAKKTIQIHEEYVPNPPKNFKMMNVKNNISKEYKDFKVNDMKTTFPEPCPIVTRSYPDCDPTPKCPSCPTQKQIEETPRPKSKCRNRKKKKLPNCDDVPRKKKVCL